MVSNTADIFHFIYGLSSFPLTNSIIFQRGRSTTNQICYISCRHSIGHHANFPSNYVWKKSSHIWEIEAVETLLLDDKFYQETVGNVGDENKYDWDQLYTVCFSCWGEWDWNGIAHSIHFLSQKMDLFAIFWMKKKLSNIPWKKKQFCLCCSPKKLCFPMVSLKIWIWVGRLLRPRWLCSWVARRKCSSLVVNPSMDFVDFWHRDHGAQRV